MIFPSKLEELAKAFELEYGRPMAILHIGNIANNAYNNAALLNSSGFDCDVICYDYFHLMGCPEWEDAEFDSSKLDHNRPNWSLVDLSGYIRPEWFAQGSKHSCIDYLLARRDKDKKKAAKLWRVLSLESKLELDSQAKLKIKFLWMRFKSFLNVVFIQQDGVRRIRQKIRGTLYLNTQHSQSWPVVSGFLITTLLAPLQILRKLLSLTSSPLVLDDKIKKESARWHETLIKTFESEFLERTDKLTTEDITLTTDSIERWKLLIDKYDLIFAYATDTIVPYICGNKPYVAYEHGTIRDIPFEETSVGRMTALAYKKANVTYLTNADSLPAAHRLKSSNIVCGLHGFNGDHFAHRINKAKTSGKLPFFMRHGVKIFFAPARHHWVHGFATWRKGNDKIIHAAHHLVQRGINDFVIVFVEWGAEVAASKRLINELRLEKYFEWISPLPKTELLRAYLSVDGVIDQFILPCLGSVTLEAIAVGSCPVITRLDDSAMSKFYGATIPLLNCSSAEEIADAMLLVIKDTVAARLVAEDSFRWFEMYHSTSVLKVKLFESINQSKAF